MTRQWMAERMKQGVNGKDTVYDTVDTKVWRTDIILSVRHVTSALTQYQSQRGGLTVIDSGGAKVLYDEFETETCF